MGTLRILLALAVALSHFGGISGYAMMNGVVAVQCFFMISGFLISFVLSTKYDADSSAGRKLFYTSRLLRIFIPYWTALAFCIGVGLLLRLSAGTTLSLFPKQFDTLSTWAQAWVILSNLFIITQEWAMWLMYDGGRLVLTWSADQSVPHLSSFQFIPQAWSMSLELMFYALAPFIVRRNSFTLICIVILCQIGRQIAFNEGLTGSGFCYRFFPFEIGLFVTGILAHRAWRFLKRGGTAVFSCIARARRSGSRCRAHSSVRVRFQPVPISISVLYGGGTPVFV